MDQYFVSVSWPCGDDETLIEVVDDIECFSPDLLAAYPIATVRDSQPKSAGLEYAEKYRLSNIRMVVNTEQEYNEWWIGQDNKLELLT